MTALVFPESADDLGDAYNNALEKGALGNEPRTTTFWGHHELQASEIEDEVIVADWFFQRNTSKHLRVSRKETEL